MAKESIFSGMNNLKTNSILDDSYSEYFGFTTEEVMEMLRYYKKEEKFQEICEWYDGYRFGDTEIFNPWSVQRSQRGFVSFYAVKKLQPMWIQV